MGETPAEYPTVPCGGRLAALSVSHEDGLYYPWANSDHICELGGKERVIEFRVSVSPSEFAGMVFSIRRIYPLLDVLVDLHVQL